MGGTTRTTNALATHALDDMGYNGGLLYVEIKHNNHQTMPLTLLQSKERVEMLRHATTHSLKFLVTQGNHLTNNDSFITAQMNVLGKDVKKLLRLKKR